MKYVDRDVSRPRPQPRPTSLDLTTMALAMRDRAMVAGLKALVAPLMRAGSRLLMDARPVEPIGERQ